MEIVHFGENNIIKIIRIMIYPRWMARRAEEKLCQGLAAFFEGLPTFWPVIILIMMVMIMVMMILIMIMAIIMMMVKTHRTSYFLAGHYPHNDDGGDDNMIMMMIIVKT